MFFNHFQHNHQTNHHEKNELNGMYFSTVFRELGLSMMAMLLPVFLLKEFGFSVSEIFIFYGIIAFTQMILIPLAGKSMAMFGPYKNMAWTTPLLALSLFLLSYMGEYKILVYILPIIWGLFNTFFWFGYHLEFTYGTKNGGGGKKMGLISILQLLVTAGAPLIGGLLTDHFGKNMLIWIASGIILLSIIPMLSYGKIHTSEKYSIKKSLKIIFSKKHKWELLSWIGVGTYTTLPGIAWPIILSFFITDYADLGMITSISIVILIFFTHFIGKFMDKGKVITLLLIGFGILLVDTFMKFGISIYLFSGITILVMSDFLRNIGSRFIGMPLDFAAYRIAQGESEPINEIMIHEIGILIGRTTTLIFCAISFLYISEGNIQLGLGILFFIGSLIGIPLAMLQIKSDEFKKIKKD